MFKMSPPPRWAQGIGIVNMHTRLYLIRHGETEDAQSNRYKGHIDVPLSEKGIMQMRQASAFIFDTVKRGGGEGEKLTVAGSPRLRVSDSNLSVVYCSDLSRAIKSAEIIANPHGIKPVIIPAFKERNFGMWEGMSFDEIKEMYPKEFKAWADNPLKFSPMQGESTIEVRDRVVKALDKIIKHQSSNLMQDTGYTIQDEKDHESCILNHESCDIAIVSHGGVNRIILCHLLGIPLENIFRIEQDFAALNIVEFYENYPVVKLINYKV